MLSKRFLLLVLCAMPVLGVTGSAAVVACPYSFRQAGFVELDPRPYSACFVVRETTAGRESLSQWIREASLEVLMASNVVATTVDIDQEPSHRAAELCESQGIATFPAVLLFSPDGEGMVVAEARQDGASKDWVTSQLGKMVRSPFREKIARSIVRDWCVVLLVEGEDAEQNRRARAEIESAARRITGSITETGLTVQDGPRILPLFPGGAQERVLLWSLGLEGEEAGPAAVVLFGRGRQLGSVFKGPLMTADALYEAFYLLGRRCVCTVDRRWLSGRSIPLKFPAWFEDEVLRRAQIDVSSPEVKLQVAPGMRWLSGYPAPEGEGNGSTPLGTGTMVTGPLGYTEIALGTDDGGAGATSPVPHVALRPARPTGLGFSFATQVKRIMFFLVVALVVAAVLGTVAVLLKGRKA